MMRWNNAMTPLPKQKYLPSKFQENGERKYDKLPLVNNSDLRIEAFRVSRGLPEHLI